MTLKGRIDRLAAAVPPVDPMRASIPTDPAEILLAVREGRLTFDDLRHAGSEHVGGDVGDCGVHHSSSQSIELSRKDEGWLNVAENELSALTRQCLRGRRFGTIEEMRMETAAGQQHTNNKQRGVD